MSLKRYLILMSMGTLICWVSWIFVLFSIDPRYAGFLGFVFFYISLFLALLGTISVIGFMIRRLIVRNDEIVFRHVKKTFRQGLTGSIFLVLVLWLWQQSLITWWIMALLVFLFLLLEGIIFTNRKYSNRDYVR